MFKIISCSFLALMLASMTFAMEPLNQEIEINSPKNYLIILPLESLLKVSETLNVKDTRSLIFTCQDLYKSKLFILLQKLPDLYGIPGQSLQSVFFPFSHPDWTPWKLESALSYTLHKSYFEAMRLKIPSAKPFLFPNDERDHVKVGLDKTIILKRYYLLYAAACGGHLDAAMQAGEMLLNTDFNEIIPAITAFGHLMPEAKEWDLRRLNQAQTINTELEKIMKKMENFAEKQEDSEIFTVKEVNFMKKILTDLSMIKETDEVKAVKLLFGEMVEAGEKELPRDFFKPKKTIQFIKGLKHITPLLQNILEQEQSEETESSRVLDPLANIPNYTGILSFSLMDSYVDILESVAYYNKSEDYIMRPRKTPEGLEAGKREQETKRIMVLLGEDLDLFVPSLLLWQTNSSEVYPQYQKVEECINTFLCHLVLTRNPTPKKFNDIKEYLKSQLVKKEFDVGLSNTARFDMLCKAFSGSSANG